MIGTKLHQLQQLIPDEPLLPKYLAAPKYYVDRDVVEIMSREDVQESVKAMIQAGIARLPFNPLLIEFKSINSKVLNASQVHFFVLLSETDGGIRAESSLMYDTDDTTMYRAVRGTTEVTLTEQAILVNTGGDEIDGTAVGLAVMMALLMLNVKGIEKRVVEVNRLNKQRMKSSKPRIPSHTVIHIGTIYDRSGKGVRYVDGGPSGRKMRVHMRRGHARHQACGEGMTERKWVYIPPVLVNYSEGDGQQPIHPSSQIIRV